MNKQLEQIHLDDLCADLSSYIEQKGARSFVQEFRSRYPQHSHELEIFFMQRDRKVAALLKA